MTSYHKNNNRNCVSNLVLTNVQGTAYLKEDVVRERELNLQKLNIYYNFDSWSNEQYVTTR